MDKQLFVIGDPIAHSLSPAIHRAIARELGLAITYEARRVTVEELPVWLDQVRRRGYDGFNATMPHKLHLIPLLDRLTDEAEYFGAVNTVRRDGDVLIGHNTDGDGFAAMLRRHGRTFRGARVAVLGAGGAAAAIVRKAVRDGAAAVAIRNRTVEKAAALCPGEPTVTAAGLEEPIPTDTDLLISTLPVQAAPDGAVLCGLGRDCAVVDILYAPPVTPLLASARERGMEAYNGLGMLVDQAILAFRFFTGAQFDDVEMARMLEALPICRQ